MGNDDADFKAVTVLTFLICKRHYLMQYRIRKRGSPEAYKELALAALRSVSRQYFSSLTLVYIPTMHRHISIYTNKRPSSKFSSIRTVLEP